MFRNNFSDLLERQTDGAHRWFALLALVLPLLAIGSVLSNHYYYATGSASVCGLGVNAETLPSAAAPVLNRPDFPGLMVNGIPEGSAILWVCPHRQVFVDGRPGLHQADLLGVAHNVFNGKPQEWDVLEARANPKPGAVLLSCVRPGIAPLAQYLLGSGRWRLAYFDGPTAILLRAVPENGALLADGPIKAAGLQHLEQVRHDYEERVARQLFPAHSPALIGAGNLYMALGRYAEADVVYTLLTKGAPHMGSVWLNLGISKLEQGQTAAALPCLRRATQRNTGDARAWLYLGRACTQAQLLQEAKEANERGQKLNPVLAASFNRAASTNAE